MNAAASEAHRPLGALSLTALGINGVVGVGIFFAPASVAEQIPGLSGALVYLGAAVMLLPIALGYAALGRRFSVDGGPYVWADAALGPRAAFSVGWITYVSSLFSVAAVVSGLSSHVAPALGITGEIGQRLTAVGIVAALALTASTGLRPSALVWSGFTIVKLIPLVTLVAVGCARYGAVGSMPSAAAAPTSLHAVSRALLVVIFASQGFEIVPLLAGSVRRSERAVPFATVTSLVLSAGLYAALHAVAVRAAPDLSASKTPLVVAASRYGGTGLAAFLGMGATLSAIGIAFGMLNTTPRYLFALSTREALGTWMGTSDAHGVPQRALWITVAAAVTLLVGSRAITELFVLSSLAVLLQYCVVLTALAVLALRGARGLGRRHLWAVPLSAAGVFFAVRGARIREIVTAACVLLFGELLRWLRHKD